MMPKFRVITDIDVKDGGTISIASPDYATHGRCFDYINGIRESRLITENDGDAVHEVFPPGVVKRVYPLERIIRFRIVDMNTEPLPEEPPAGVAEPE